MQFLFCRKYFPPSYNIVDQRNAWNRLSHPTFLLELFNLAKRETRETDILRHVYHILTHPFWRLYEYWYLCFIQQGMIFLSSIRAIKMRIFYASLFIERCKVVGLIDRLFSPQVIKYRYTWLSLSSISCRNTNKL